MKLSIFEARKILYAYWTRIEFYDTELAAKYPERYYPRGDMFWDITERRNMNINGAIEVCRMFGLKFDNVRVYQRNVDKALQVLSHAWRIIDRRCDEIKSVEAVAKAE